MLAALWVSEKIRRFVVGALAAEQKSTGKGNLEEVHD